MIIVVARPLRVAGMIHTVYVATDEWETAIIEVDTDKAQARARAEEQLKLLRAGKFKTKDATYG